MDSLHENLTNKERNNQNGKYGNYCFENDFSQEIDKGKIIFKTILNKSILFKIIIFLICFIVIIVMSISIIQKNKTINNYEQIIKELKPTGKVIPFEDIDNKSNFVTLYNNIDDEEYKFMISIDKSKDNLVFIVDQIENISSEYYYKIISLKDLKKIGKTFSECNTIDDVIKTMKYIIFQSDYNDDENFQISLSKDKNKKVNVNIKNFNKSLGKDDFSFVLLEEKKIINDVNTYLINYINRIKEIAEVNLLNDFYFIQSEIINRPESISFITDYIRSIEKKNFYYKLIYQSSENGDKAGRFHKLCDDKSPILAVIKTKEDVIFGGYTTITINTLEKSYDSKAFIFNVNNKKIYRIKDGEYAINNGKYDDSLLIFSDGPGVIVVGEDFLDGIYYATCKKDKSSFDGMTIDYEINNGKKQYAIKELEIYKLYFK